MAQAFRFQFLLEQAQEKSDKAARLMAEVKAQWQAAEQKLQQLQSFVDDYRNRFVAAQSGGLSVNQWRDYRLFMAKLDAALKQQSGEVELLRQRFDEAKSRWLDTQREVKAMQALAEREARMEQAKQAKREQKELDEYASKLAYRRTSERQDE